MKSLGVAVAVALGMAFATGPAAAQENAPAGPEFTSNGSVEPIQLEGGSAGWQRRSSLKSPLAMAPKTGLPGARPLMRPRPDGGSARNAIGIAVQGTPATRRDDSRFSGQTEAETTGINTAKSKDGGVNFRAPAVPLDAGLSLRGAALNGTTMGHIASGPASIGGPAKDRSGINGTALRPKR